MLGSILLSHDALAIVAPLLRPEHFIEPRHRRIFDAMLKLDEQRIPPDLVTLQQHAGVEGAVLVELLEAVPTAANAEHYANIVRDVGIRRQLLDAQATIGSLVAEYDGPMGGRLALDKAQELLGEIDTFDPKRQPAHEGDIVEDALGWVEEARGRQGVSGLTTGLPEYDDLTGGLHPGELTILAGRPGMGKTAVGLDWAHRVGLEQPSLVFSYEMTPRALGLRRLAMVSGVSLHKIRTAKLEDGDLGKLRRGSAELRASHLHAVDARGMGILDIRMAARRFAAKQGLSLIVVDYIGLVALRQVKGVSRSEAIGEVSKGLLLLAGELHVPVVALTQLNRGCEARDDKRPLLSDLRDSGDLEQDADVVCFAYRPGYYRPDDEAASDQGELIVRKQRSGPPGTVKVLWDGPTCRYVSRRRGQQPLFAVPAASSAPVGTRTWVVEIARRISDRGPQPLSAIQQALVSAGLSTSRADDADALRALLAQHGVSLRSDA